MGKFIKFINKIVRLKCPSCDGYMQIEMLDMEIDRLVYKCENCQKEWI